MGKYSFILILIMALVTLVVRFLPFALFRGKNTPGFITYLGSVSPYAIMGMLVVYCLRNINFLSGSRGIPEVLACLVVILLQSFKKNTLLSVSMGTIFYMLLIQLVFK